MRHTPRCGPAQVNAPSAIPWVVLPGDHQPLDSTELANPDTLPLQRGYGAILAGSTQSVYSATVRGLSPGSRYRFSLQAMDNDFNSGYIAELEFTTAAAAPETLPHGALLLYASLPAASAAEVRSR
jgi:hypothetical protein